jgi:hypothetical protein
MSLPHTYTDKNETGCCAIPDVEQWDKKELVFENKHFIRLYTRSFLYVPLNMSKIMTALNETAEQASATMPPQDAMILSRDLSPWKAEQLYAVTRPVDEADNVTLNGTFLSIVNEGPYKDAKKWYTMMVDFARNQGKTLEATYFFYTTCPKCAKHYGKNYVITLGQVT